VANLLSWDPMITDHGLRNAECTMPVELHKLKAQLSDALLNIKEVSPALVLIGPSGAGKTSVGAEFAKRQNLIHIDMDCIIEASSKLSIPDIFAVYGEAGFRELENHLLDTCVSKAVTKGHISHPTRSVVSAGGGTPVFLGNFEKMQKLGIVVGLIASTDTLLERLDGKEKRPMLEKTSNTTSKRETLEALLAARKKIYEQAAFTIDTTELSIKDVVALIEKKLCQ
jgi:shikimate kinase